MFDFDHVSLEVAYEASDPGMERVLVLVLNYCLIELIQFLSEEQQT
jgi:hypothetical protein